MAILNLTRACTAVTFTLPFCRRGGDCVARAYYAKGISKGHSPNGEERRETDPESRVCVHLSDNTLMYTNTGRVLFYFFLNITECSTE